MSKSHWLSLLLGASSVVACSAANSPSKETQASPGEDAGGGGSAGAVATTGGSGGGTSGSGGKVEVPTTDAGADVTPSCGSFDLPFNVTRGNVLVLFDQSNSMTNEWENGLPRWQVAKEAIEGALDPQLQSVLNLGTLFFPSTVGGTIIIGGAANCPTGWVEPITQSPQIPLMEGPAFLAQFSAHFGPAFSTIKSTPLPVVLEFADQALPDPAPIPGKRIVVLLSDGKTTCGETKVLQPVKNMFARGILTYVIGLPGADAGIAMLNQLATEGGTGAPLTPSDGIALKDALGSLAKTTVDQCTLNLDPPPPALDDVHLIVTDAATPGGYEILPTSGWELSPDGATVTLTGELCEQVKNASFNSVKFIYGCPESVIE